jgi:beta-lactamase class A
MSTSEEKDTEALYHRVSRIARESGAESVAVAYHDSERGTAWSLHGDRWFHAASTIKIPVLAGLFAATDAGDFHSNDRVHVRNRFMSIVDGRPYRVSSARDASPLVHRAIGRTLPLRELARHMIATSSNLATNLLVELVGVDAIRDAIDRLGVSGIDFHRGVEDELAWREGINNRVTARGLVDLLRKIEEGNAFSARSTEAMLDILHAQEFRSGIPAGLPSEARVAHKTGEISTVAHDAGLVFLPEREPYALAVLTEWDPDATGRQETIAAISRAVYEHLSSGGTDG